MTKMAAMAINSKNLLKLEFVSMWKLMSPPFYVHVQNMQARVIVLVHHISCRSVLLVYQVSLKYLLRFTSNRAGTKLYGK